MGNSVSSLPCIINKNEKSQEPVNAIIDLVHSNSGGDNLGAQQPKTNTIGNANHRKDIIQDDSIYAKWTRIIQRIFQFLKLPRRSLFNDSIHPRLHHPIPVSSRHKSTSTSTGSTKNGTMNNNHSLLLRRCETIQEQHTYIMMLLESCQHLHGRDGLHALGLEYRCIPCAEHKPPPISTDVEISCAAVDSVQSIVYNCNGDDIRDQVYLSERALHKVETMFDIDDGSNNLEQQREGQVTLVELAKVKSEQLFNRSDSVLSDDGGDDGDMSTNDYKIGRAHV